MKMPAEGFLSPLVSDWRSVAHEAASERFALAYEINQACVAILSTLEPSFRSDRELIGAALFGRALQSFEATILLAERGMVADAGLVARSIVECAIFQAAVATIDDFPKRMAASNNAHFASMARSVADQLAAGVDKAEHDQSQDIRKLLEEIASTAVMPADIKLRQLARETGMERLYEIVYRKLSGEAAHPSLASIERHFRRDEQGLIAQLIFAPQVDGLSDLLGSAVTAGLANLQALAETFRRTDIADIYKTFNDRHRIIAMERQQPV